MHRSGIKKEGGKGGERRTLRGVPRRSEITCAPAGTMGERKCATTYIASNTLKKRRKKVKKQKKEKRMMAERKCATTYIASNTLKKEEKGKKTEKRKKNDGRKEVRDHVHRLQHT